MTQLVVQTDSQFLINLDARPLSEQFLEQNLNDSALIDINKVHHYLTALAQKVDASKV
jgi:hypothetical protein